MNGSILDQITFRQLPDSGHIAKIHCDASATDFSTQSALYIGHLGGGLVEFLPLGPIRGV